MYIENLFISEKATVIEAMKQLDATGKRILFIADGGLLKAVIADADIRRFIIKGGDLNAHVCDVANYSPKTLKVEQRAQAKDFLLKNSIDAVPLLNGAGVIEDVIFLNASDILVKKQAGLPVVIMAGGLGTRLYPYTKILPKPLIPVGELPIIEHIINRFLAVGSKKFNIIVNYKKNMIKSYFGDIVKNYDVYFADEDVPLGTGGGLSLLKQNIEGTFFLTNCDVLIDADYGDIYEYHKKNGNVVTVVCAVKNIVIPYGVIELSDGGEIKDITEKPHFNFLTNTGLYVVEKRVVDELEGGENISFPDIIERYRTKGERVGVYPVSEQSWMDMGQMEELEQMRRKLEMQG